MSSSESSEHEESLHSRSISESENGDSSEVDIVVSGIKPLRERTPCQFER